MAVVHKVESGIFKCKAGAAHHIMQEIGWAGHTLAHP